MEAHFYEAWEKEEALTKLEIATIQLRSAIEHFMRHDYIPAITLAGAADEILGRLAKKMHGEHAADRYCKQRINEWALVGRTIPMTPKDVLKDLNWVRNDLKHNDQGTDHVLTRFYGQSALKLIDAGLLNLLLVSDFLPPSDAVIAKYHKEFPSWNGAIPVRVMAKPRIALG